MDAGALDEVLDFCRRHPSGPWRDAELRHVLSALLRGPDAIVAVRDRKGLAAVAVVIDTCDNARDAAMGHVLAVRPDAGAEVLDQVLTEAVATAAAGPRSVLDLEIAAADQAAIGRLRRAGFAEAFRAYDMVRARAFDGDGPVRWPAGLRLSPADRGHAARHHATVVAAFAGIPAAFIPPLPDFTANLGRSDRHAFVVLDGDDDVQGFFAVAVDDDGITGEIATLGRHPRARGRGLGDALLSAALADLAARGARRFRLNVVADNADGLALYRRHDFAVVTELATWGHPLRARM